MVHNQIFVTLMGTLLSVFFLLNNNSISSIKISIIFLTYINGYSYTKFQNISQKFNKILFLNVISLSIGILLHVYYEMWNALCKWFIIIFLGLFYNTRFLWIEIRKIPLVKIFFVGFIWALVNAWLMFETMQWGIFFTTWLYITALIIPFDIRDEKQDDILTFPKLIGTKKSRFLAIMLLLMSLLPSMFFLKGIYFWSFFASVLVSIGFALFADEKRGELYFSIGVESCVGLPFLFSILMN